MSFWSGLLLGLALGALIGVTATALAVAAGRRDDDE